MKKNMGGHRWKSIVLIFLGVLAVTLGYGQADETKALIPQPVPTSPNVASLGKYIDFPVGYFTGVPEISIPIYEVKSGGLSVPISLNYHASGIKPTDVASWVGMGWSLSAGGQLSRNVKGKPDEEYYYDNKLNADPTVCDDFFYLKYSATGVTDTEPDVYSYSFPGRNGKFIMLPPPANSLDNPPPFLFPYAPFKITQFDPYKFEIVDDQGNLYRYGKNSAGSIAVEGTRAVVGGNPSLTATTAWQLMDIVAPNSNDKISLNYQDNGTTYTFDISQYITIADLCTSSNGGGCPNNTFEAQRINNETYTTQEVLSSIVFETGKVDFILGDDRNDYVQQQSTSLSKSLSEIRIYERIGTGYNLRKIIRFVYSYFKNSDGDDEALKLDELQFADASSLVIQRYKFKYNTDSFSWLRSSENFLAARDWWGYYNGAMSNTDLIEKDSAYVEPQRGAPGGAWHDIGGAVSRAPNFTYISEGVLSRIDYPTGGFTAFEYEANRDGDGASGSLRVKKITSSTGGSELPIVKTYKYGLGGSGVGTRNYNTSQQNYFGQQWIASSCLITDPSYSYQVRTYFSMSAYSLDGFDGAPVRYNYVTEYFGGSFDNNGYIEYIYDGGLSENDFQQVVINSPGKYYTNDYSWKRSKLTSKKIFNAAAQPVSWTTTHYKLYQDAESHVGWGVSQYVVGDGMCGAVQPCQNDSQVNPDTFHFTRYYQKSGVLVADQTVEVSYENGNPSKSVTITTDRVNDASKLVTLTESVTRSFTPEVRVTSLTYPFQLSANPTSTAGAKALYMLTNKNIFTTPVEKFVVLQNDDGSNQRVISSEVTTFKANASNSNQVVPDQIFLFESATPVLKASYNQVVINGANNNLTMNSNLKARIQFASYDSDGNLLTFSKLGNVSTYIKYGYNNAFPIAQVSNASADEVLLENFEDLTPSSSVLADATIARSGRQYYNGDYTATFSAPGGKSYFIDYWYRDTDNSWKYKRQTYAGSSVTLSDGTAIDDVRIYPKNSQVSTYTYDQIFGKTSETDLNGQTVFYEFDLFGRLTTIKDTMKNILKTYEYQYTLKLD